MFLGRCPEDEFMITTYIGGATDPDVIDMSDDDIENMTFSAIEKTMGISAQPEYIEIRRLPQAIPQYNVGHRDRLEQIDEELKKLPGVFLTGNYLNGISLSSVIVNARNAVEHVLGYLKV